MVEEENSPSVIFLLCSENAECNATLDPVIMAGRGVVGVVPI